MLFFFCCKQKTQFDINLAVFEQEKIKKTEIIKFDNTEYIDSCQFIQLETTEKSLFGEITQLETFEEKFYIYDRQTKKIKVFDHTGKFLNDIGKLGQGPGEYINISFFFLNPKEKKIGLYDPSKSAIHEYTLIGNFLRTVKLPNNQDLSCVRKSVFIDDFIFCYSCINDGENYTYIILSSNNYLVVKTFCPYPVKPLNPMYAIVMNHPFSFVDGKFHYLSLFSDTIFAYVNEEAIPYLFVETGKPNISSTSLKERELDFVDNPLQTCVEVWRDDKYSPGFTELGETDRFIIIRYNFNNSFYFLDKMKNSGFHVENSFLPNLGTPSAIEGNKIIRIWNPFDISTYKEFINNEKGELPKQLDDLLRDYDPDNDNPVLVVYYMKNNLDER